MPLYTVIPVGASSQADWSYSSNNPLDQSVNGNNPFFNIGAILPGTGPIGKQCYFAYMPQGQTFGQIENMNGIGPVMPIKNATSYEVWAIPLDMRGMFPGMPWQIIGEANASPFTITQGPQSTRPAVSAGAYFYNQTTGRMNVPNAGVTAWVDYVTGAAA